jgi:hypothetical protein
MIRDIARTPEFAMKAFILGFIFLSFSLPAAARCVVEIFDEEGEPMGHVYQESECRSALAKCKAQLIRLNIPNSTCEITLDIPGNIDASN